MIGKPVKTPNLPNEPNTKRKTEDILMDGLSPMGQRVFGEYQKILVMNPDIKHELAIQQLMFQAEGPEQIAAILEMNTFQMA